MRRFYLPRLPKRAMNRCRACGYTWHPKGHAISLKCPSCGSTEVGFIPSGGPGCAGCLQGCGWLVILGVLVMLVRGCSSSTNNPAATDPPPAATATPPPAAPPAPEVRRALPILTPTVAPPPAAGYTVTGVARGDFLNVRGGPGATFPVVAKLPNGFSGVHLLGSPVMNGPTEWVQISFSNQSGWVTKGFLRAD